MATCKFFPKPVEILNWKHENEDYVQQEIDLDASYARAASLDYDEYLAEMIRLGEQEGRPSETLDWYRQELWRVKRECDPDDLKNITPEEYAKLPKITFKGASNAAD